MLGVSVRKIQYRLKEYRSGGSGRRRGLEDDVYLGSRPGVAPHGQRAEGAGAVERLEGERPAGMAASLQIGAKGARALAVLPARRRPLAGNLAGALPHEVRPDAGIPRRLRAG